MSQLVRRDATGRLNSRFLPWSARSAHIIRYQAAGTAFPFGDGWKALDAEKLFRITGRHTADSHAELLEEALLLLLEAVR